jgi:UDP-N-acetylmuramyl pentapeptide synthase
LADDILARARVALVPGVAFGPTGEAHLRVCYARELADIDRAFERLTDYFAGRTPRTYALPASAPTPQRQPVLRAAGVRVLHALARLCLARSRPRVVAIAGSRGKTVLKRTLTELLGAHLRVRCNPLSYNTEVGLAFAVLETQFDARRPLSVVTGGARAVWHALFPKPVDVLVLELGARRRYDMRGLLRVVRPDVAVITPLAPSYTEDQASLATLRAEMKDLIDTMGSGGMLAVCVDDAVLAELATAPLTQLFGKHDVIERAGRRFLHLDGHDYPLGCEIVGDSSLYALVASVIVARHLGVSDETIERFLAG